LQQDEVHWIENLNKAKQCRQVISKEIQETLEMYQKKLREIFSI